MVRVRGVVGFFFQAEDGIRDLVRSRGLGDVYKRQPPYNRSVNPSALRMILVSLVTVVALSACGQVVDLSLIHI